MSDALRDRNAGEDGLWPGLRRRARAAWAPLPAADPETPRTAWTGLRRLLLWPRLWIIAAAALLIYAALGALALPPLVKGWIEHEVEARYGREIDIGGIGVNPFTLTLDLREVRIPDADAGEPALSFELLRLNFSASGLWRGGFAFDEVRLDSPRVRLERRSDGRVNLSDFAPEAGAPSGKPLRLFIRRLTVSDGALAYADLARARPFAKHASPIAFTLTNFSTHGADNAFSLAANGDRGERIAWTGAFSLEPFASSGRFELSDLDAPTLADWFGAELPFVMQSGKLDLNGGYELALAGDAPTLRIALSQGALRSFALRPDADSADWATLANGQFSDTRIDVGARSVEIAEARFADPFLLLARERDGSINLARLIPVSKPAPTAAPETPWRITAAALAVTNGRFTIEDRTLARPARFEISGARINVAGLALPGDAPFTLDAEARLNSEGVVSASGPVRLAPASADLALDAANIDLIALQPYLDQTTSIHVRSGAGFADGALRYDQRGLRFRGAARVTGLRTTDTVLSQDFVSWRSLSASGVDFTAEPFSLRVRQIGLNGAEARVVIAADGEVNIAAALRPAGQAPAARIVAIADGAVAAASTASAPARVALPIEIGVVRIENSALDFADHSIQPNFAVALQDIGGTVTGLSGAADARADVALEGAVDRYAPATIEGQVNYFAAQAYTDLAMRFRNVEMTTLSPYSGRFAGYAVERGKLDVDLNYHVENQRLDARHRIVITQLQLGDRVDSDQRVRIPVRLAIALLTDRNGVIDVDLPVTGTLDDPRFRLGPIIWRVFMNLMTRIATAPFALLGALGGGDDVDLEYVAFAPGEAALDETARANLATLRTAMETRPGVSIDVPMTYNPALDLEGLAAVRVRALERAAASERLGRRAQDPAALDDALADPDERQEALERVYRTLAGRRPEVPPTPDGGDDTVHKVAWLEGACRELMTVTEADLLELGRARAGAVQDVLLEAGSVDPGRVFVIAQRQTPPPEAGDVRMRLAVSE